MADKAWVPAAILGAGCILLVTVAGQQPRHLTAPLNSIPTEVEGFKAKDLTIDPAELKVAGPNAYLMRLFQDSSHTRLSLYVGFYEQQRQGKTIHSPKNCLPGAGWEPVQAGIRKVDAPGGAITINQYLIAKGSAQALVFYWYQGRGRVEANEYRVKLQMIRDAALSRRSDEALVRIVVPVETTRADAEALGVAAVKRLYPALASVLPG